MFTLAMRLSACCWKSAIIVALGVALPVTGNHTSVKRLLAGSKLVSVPFGLLNCVAPSPTIRKLLRTLATWVHTPRLLPAWWKMPFSPPLAALVRITGVPAKTSKNM